MKQELSLKETLRPDAEKALIAHVMIWPEVAAKFCGMVKPKDFSLYPDYAQAIHDCYSKGKLVNYLTVAQACPGDFNDNAVELMGFKSVSALPSEFEKWVMLLFEECLRDDMKRLGTELQAEQVEDVFDHLHAADERVLEMVARLRTKGYKPDDILRMLLERDDVITYGMPLDVNVTTTDLVVVAARPSMGKTAFAVKCALNMARAGVPVLFMSREMSARQIGARVISILSRIPCSRILTQTLHQDEEEKFHQAVSEFQALPFFIDEPPMDGAATIAKCRELIANEGVRAIFIDYVQLFTAKAESREREIAWLSCNFKALAKDSNVPVMLLSQLNREVEKRKDKIPLLSDLRESGAIEQDADVVMMLCRPEYYADPEEFYKVGGRELPPHQLAVIGVEKYRNGETGRRAMRFIGEYMDFVPYE